jgi:predicted permease
MPGELDELFDRRTSTHGVWRARWWYRAQVASLALRLGASAARRAAGGGFHAPSRPAGGALLDAWLRDGRYALRSLLRRPAFTLVATASLAVGIGANSAAFSVVNALLIRRLPLPELERWVEVYTSDDDGNAYVTSSYPDIRELRERGRGVFEEVVSYEVFVNPVERGGETTVLVGELVSGNYFAALRARPWAGRLLTRADDTPESQPVAVLSHAYWTRELGQDPAVIGQTLVIRQRAVEIVGIAPPEVTGTYPALVAAAWLPAAHVNLTKGSGGAERTQDRGNRSTFVKARLAPGVTVASANEWLRALSLALEQEYPESNEGRVMSALPSGEVSIHPLADRALRPAATLLMGAVGTVLLIACVNLASFLLARAEDRRREVAVRLALGARRVALIRTFLMETVLLALAGGAGGVLLAHGVLGLLARFQPPLLIPVQLALEVDRSVLLFTLLVSIAAGLFFGLVPALPATRGDAAPALKEDAATFGARRLRLGAVLVVAQVAFSFLLLVGAGLFARSLARASDIDPGFYTGNAGILAPNLDFSGEQDPEAWSAFWSELEERIESHPGVEGVAFADVLPLGVAIQTVPVRVPGVDGPSQDGSHSVDFAWVSPSWFEVMDVPVLSGRGFGVEDGGGAARVAVVSEAFVTRMWPGGDALGRRIEVNEGDPVTVVGVARDTKVRTLGEAPRPRLYFPHAQQALPAYQVVVRGRLPSAELARVASDAAKEIRPGVVIMESKTMEQHLALMLFPARAAALLLGVFGALALLLSATGIYGLVSHTVARRDREMGIRMSLGASPSDVVRLSVGGGMRLVGVGGALGTALAAAAALLMSRFLYGVEALDPVTFASIPALLGGVGLLAAWAPARRAGRVDPARTLKSD